MNEGAAHVLETLRHAGSTLSGEALSAQLELGARPALRSRREALDRVLKQRLRRKHREHLLRIVRPVGRQVQHAAGGELARGERGERRLHQPPLVMALFRPRVRKEDVHAVKGHRWNHVAQHLDRVVLDYANVGEAVFDDAVEQASHARRVHLDADIVVFRMCRSNARAGFAHARPDFENPRRSAPESSIEIERRAGVRYAEPRQQRLARAPLRAGEAALSQHVAADGSSGRVHGEIGQPGRVSRAAAMSRILSDSRRSGSHARFSVR